ncbi:MAG: hypothetical protein ACKO04_10405 [Actinomycetes bacterium]
MKKRALAVAMALLMTVGVMEFGLGGSNPVAAAPISKSVSGTCTGADAATLGLLNTLGGASLAVDFRVDGDVPKSLDPGQKGASASFSWSVTLDQALVNKAAGFGVKDLGITKTKLNIAVSGPTSTKAVSGSPADASLALSPGVPAVLSRGPFSAPLENVGDSGVINYTVGGISFTIGVALAGRAIDLNIVCSAPALIASTPIKVPGAPDIVQPIEVRGAAGVGVPIDIVGVYTKAGRTPLVPSSLRVVSGPATVQNGRLVVTGGAAGSATSATFEICGQPVQIADQQAGGNEVQRLTLDPNVDTFKKGVGFSLKVGDSETTPIWTAELGLLGFLGGLQLGTTFPTNWTDVANNYGTGTQYLAPAAATIQSALEELPGIGKGNVKVTKVQQVNRPTYELAFQGALAEKDVPEVKIGRYLSVFPQENLDALIAVAGSLGSSGGGEGGATTTTVVPEGLTTEEYLAQLQAEIGELIAAGDFNNAGDKLSLLVRLSLSNALANINVQETIASLNNLFPEKPKVETTTPGTEPVPAQFQDLCAQGSATVVVAAVTPAVAPTPPAPAVLPAIAFRPPVRKYCYTTRRTYRVRIKGTKRYRRVTRNVRVCSSSSFAKRKAAAQAAAARKAAAKRAAARKAAAKRAAAKRAATARR